MTEENMSTKARYSKRRRRRQLALMRTIILIIIAVLTVTLILLRINVLNGRKLDTAISYDLKELNGAVDLSDFTLQSADSFASGLVSADAETNADQIMLQQDDERALLFNIDDNTAIYSTGIYDRIYPASLTKIMTALLALEYGNMNDSVTMIDADFDLGEADAQTSELETGDTVSFEDLFRLLVVYSANEAAMAIARTIGGSVDNFVAMMNEKAEDLGMTGTHFVNPSGLHDDDHYTTPYDIYLMMNAAYQYPEFAQNASLSQFQVSVEGTQGSSTFVEESTDEYLTGIYSLPQNVTIMASKTGTTDEAGSCLCLVVQNEYGVSYIAVVTGAWTKDDLYGDMTNVLSLING